MIPANFGIRTAKRPLAVSCGKRQSQPRVIGWFRDGSRVKAGRRPPSGLGLDAAVSRITLAKGLSVMTFLPTLTAEGDSPPSRWREGRETCGACGGAIRNGVGGVRIGRGRKVGHGSPRG